ncbi:MAG TPA: PilN domain-containing protein [Armatimonadaceae bacterium]|nr:PilN domain-containing protein [Armatimonadaceae bacterium]
MPNINLISARREEKKRLETLTRQLFTGVAASAALLMLTGLYLGGRTLTLNGELASLNAEMLRLQPTLDRIAEVETETASLTPKVDTLEGARLSTLRWPTLFMAISQSLPSGTWLSNLTSTGGAEDTNLTLTGMTSSQTLVGQTMSQIQLHPIFGKADLTFSNTTNANTDDKVQRVQFEIKAQVRPVRRAEQTAEAPTGAADGEGGPKGLPARRNLEGGPADAAAGSPVGGASVFVTPQAENPVGKTAGAVGGQNDGIA